MIKRTQTPSNTLSSLLGDRFRYLIDEDVARILLYRADMDAQMFFDNYISLPIEQLIEIRLHLAAIRLVQQKPYERKQPSWPLKGP